MQLQMQDRIMFDCGNFVSCTICNEYFVVRGAGAVSRCTLEFSFFFLLPLSQFGFLNAIVGKYKHHFFRNVILQRLTF